MRSPLRSGDGGEPTAEEVACSLYTPTLRTQIRLIESGEGATDEYGRLAKRGTVVGIVLAVDVIAIVFLTVTKPLL